MTEKQTRSAGAMLDDEKERTIHAHFIGLGLFLDEGRLLLGELTASRQASDGKG